MRAFDCGPAAARWATQVLRWHDADNAKTAAQRKQAELKVGVLHA
jgi:hypothetical protein